VPTNISEENATSVNRVEIYPEDGGTWFMTPRSTVVGYKYFVGIRCLQFNVRLPCSLQKFNALFMQSQNVETFSVSIETQPIYSSSPHIENVRQTYEHFMSWQRLRRHS
jgi:hypothetical protein